MADRAKKISELTAASGVVNSDLLLIVANTSGTKITKSVTVNNFINAINDDIGNSVVAEGEIWVTQGGKLAGNSELTFTNGTFSVVSNVELGIMGSGDAVLHFHGAIASNVHPDTPNNYFIGTPSHPWNTLWVSSLRTGNLSYSDTGVIVQMARSTDDYLQCIMQNESATSNASINYNVSNDLANSSANYGEMGMNSSAFVGDTSAFSHPSAVYFAAATSNLAIGTYGENPVHVVVNSDPNLTWTFGTNGILTLPDNTDIGAIEGSGTSGIAAPINAYLLFETSTGIPNGISSITGSSGSWELNPQSNLATVSTSGNGTGLTVNIAENGGYIDVVTIVNPGYGYVNGEAISVTSGSSSGTFIITAAPQTSITAFNPDGSFELGGPITYLRVGTVSAVGSGDPVYPTGIDLGKTVIKLGDNDGSYYTLSDGTEGQVIHLVRKHDVTSISYNNIHILVANAYYGTNQLTNQNLYFAPGQDLITLIFTDGAWQQNGGTWD